MLLPRLIVHVRLLPLFFEHTPYLRRNTACSHRVTDAEAIVFFPDFVFALNPFTTDKKQRH